MCFPRVLVIKRLQFSYSYLYHPLYHSMIFLCIIFSNCINYRCNIIGDRMSNWHKIYSCHSCRCSLIFYIVSPFISVRAYIIGYTIDLLLLFYMEILWICWVNVAKCLNISVELAYKTNVHSIAEINWINSTLGSS